MSQTTSLLGTCFTALAVMSASACLGPGPEPPKPRLGPIAAPSGDPTRAVSSITCGAGSPVSPAVGREPGRAASSSSVAGQTALGWACTEYS